MIKLELRVMKIVANYKTGVVQTVEASRDWCGSDC